MPRPRTIPDEVVLQTALDIVRRSGPSALSFAALADRVGLAGSTLVQRFGTKADLLQAALLLAWDQLDVATATADAAAPDGPDGVVEMLVALSGGYDAHDYADQLLVLREDLRDPVLRARGDAWISTLSDAIERRLSNTAAGGDGLGELIVAHWQGSLTVWSFTRPGSISDHVRRSLDSLIARLTG